MPPLQSPDAISVISAIGLYVSVCDHASRITTNGISGTLRDSNPVSADYPDGIADLRSQLSPGTVETETRIYVSALDRICPASSPVLPRGNVI